MSNKKMLRGLTQERLKEFFLYDKSDGVFFRHSSNRGRGKVGIISGPINSTGYLTIRIDGINYLAHRLAFLYVNGEFPENHVDHINGDRLDNKFSNLRFATHSENRQNSKLSSHSTTMLKGVTFHKRVGKYQARIGVNGKRLHLGYFDTKELAYNAYCKSALENHMEFARV